MNKKNNAYLVTHDPFIISVYSAEKTIEFYGEDGLEEMGIQLPEELLERYRRNRTEFLEIQSELQKFKELQDNKPF